ncbi:MAG: N-acetylmuramic acid 6-phosphate etherase [Planctomycetaceae bacterium]|jgi:N-acetylmuramic acid 6-phosphate etherase|nr:N-acetylmuramic acid 6-phosphate etherase [Planctomycetaceae bacterium]MCE2814171.1 N-acetylmuramic acid 6-phosphate etherase [Planctomycetaceae bacterium]
MDYLTTEQNNPDSIAIDQMEPIEIARLMNLEDHKVLQAVDKVLPAIAQAIQTVTQRIENGGRLIYIGAGTSGRLGVLDASECPPTFNTPPSLVVGLIAGGQRALTTAIEGAEDNAQAGAEDLRGVNLSPSDVVCGIATSGRTPYVLGALTYARTIQAATIGVTCNEVSELSTVCDILIAPVVGPEILSGSTRLKAGTATKLVLNMISTGTMIRIGKTYGNWMVDLRATNVKLKDRSIRIVSGITGLGRNESELLLAACDGEVKTAIVSHTLGISKQAAQERLLESGGRLRSALGRN